MLGSGSSAFALGLVAGWSAVFLRLSKVGDAKVWLVPLLWLMWAPALVWVAGRIGVPLYGIAAGALLGAALHQLLLSGVEARRAR